MSAMNSARAARPGWVAIAAIYLALAAEITRTLAATPDRAQWLVYLALYATFAALFTFVLVRPNARAEFLHLYFGVQSALILLLLALNPALDFVTALFTLLSYQAALVFSDRTRWLWVGVFALLAAGALIFYLGALLGLALAVAPIAVGIILAAYVAANQELEQARASSQTLLDDLKQTHQQLQAHDARVQELAALQERNRLARELHDSVSQTIFSITLDTRAAQILLARNPTALKPQLEKLQTLTQSALAQIRSLITERRT